MKPTATHDRCPTIFAPAPDPSRRSRLIPAALTGGLWLLLLAPPAWGSAPGQVHFPDLQTQPPADLRIERHRGVKLLRFSNTVANRGDGPLELAPVNQADGTTDAYQVFYTHDASGNWSAVGRVLVGTFEFHPTHNHWHLADFALYELRAVAADGSIGDRVISSSKVTFCLLDSTVDDATLEHASPAQNYRFCGRTLPQGISVGWADTYGWSLPDQHLDISNVGSGDYWLVSFADPSDRLFEGGDVRELNNAAAVKVHLQGNSVAIVP